jgi:hypothetical protein
LDTVEILLKEEKTRGQDKDKDKEKGEQRNIFKMT